MKWDRVKIEDICIGIYDGPHATPQPSESGAIFLGISNFNNGKLDLSDIRYISEADLPTWTKRVVPKPNDIVFSYEATLNLYAIIPEGFRGCLGRRMALLRTDESKVYYKFLYYYFYSDAWRAVIQENIVLGATVDRIPLTKFPEFEVNLPKLESQHRIADILSSYDNLIENNQREIKLLEEAAQRLYKEWFVDLRFPGYEDVPIVDGVPEGWERNRTDSFFSISIGKTPPRAEKQWFVSGSDGIPWLSISDMGSADAFAFVTNEALTEEAVNKFHVKVVPPGTVFVSFKLTVGRVAIAAMDMCTNEAIAHFHIEDAFMRAYTYCYLCNFEYDTLGSTSSISKAVNSKIIKSMPFVMPRREVVQAFSKQVDPLLDMIKNKQLDCIKLKEARDRLLPKLMSGELEV